MSHLNDRNRPMRMTKDGLHAFVDKNVAVAQTIRELTIRDELVKDINIKQRIKEKEETNQIASFNDANEKEKLAEKMIRYYERKHIENSSSRNRFVRQTEKHLIKTDLSNMVSAYYMIKGIEIFGDDYHLVRDKALKEIVFEDIVKSEARIEARMRLLKAAKDDTEAKAKRETEIKAKFEERLKAMLAEEEKHQVENALNQKDDLDLIAKVDELMKSYRLN